MKIPKYIHTQGYERTYEKYVENRRNFLLLDEESYTVRYVFSQGTFSEDKTYHYYYKTHAQRFFLATAKLIRDSDEFVTPSEIERVFWETLELTHQWNAYAYHVAFIFKDTTFRLKDRGHDPRVTCNNSALGKVLKKYHWPSERVGIGAKSTCVFYSAEMMAYFENILTGEGN
jgi:hypothetical protein